MHSCYTNTALRLKRAFIVLTRGNSDASPAKSLGPIHILRNAGRISNAVAREQNKISYCGARKKLSRDSQRHGTQSV
jgi:hypothetical protein